jgi:glycylpeptide N-tetradecanoyltransferase
LPEGFVWSTVDITDQKQRKETYTLLNENYVEDDECTFRYYRFLYINFIVTINSNLCLRFDYSEAFLEWALCPKGYFPDWIIGVRAAKSNKLTALITAIPASISVHGVVSKMAEINFLCVHKKLRSKRLAPVLIKEVTRRVNLQGRWQAVYTAGAMLPRPVAKCRYYHRTLNAKKLIEVRIRLLYSLTCDYYYNHYYYRHHYYYNII